jgi:hypothetical protein
MQKYLFASGIRHPDKIQKPEPSFFVFLFSNLDEIKIREKL